MSKLLAFDPAFIGPTYPVAVIFTSVIGKNNDDDVGLLLPVIGITPDKRWHSGTATTYHVMRVHCFETAGSTVHEHCAECRGYLFNTDSRVVQQPDDGNDTIYVHSMADIVQARMAGFEVKDRYGVLGGLDDLIGGEPT
jgi:hypothetical protein